jgi:nucleotide-binding universal stress UspA family protein
LPSIESRRVAVSEQTYLVAVDGSEWGIRAADHAVNMAKTSGAAVRLITVVPWSNIKPMPVDNAAHRPIEKEAEEPTIKKRVLTPILEKHENSGVDVSSEIHWGDPVDTISERVKGAGVTQLFAGRRGRSRVADLVVGSVANSLAHTVDKPIVLVP